MTAQVKVAPPLVWQIEAEACPGVPAAARREDPLASAGAAVLTTVDSAPYQLDCGDLSWGVHVLYVIARVSEPTAYVGEHLRPLYMRAEITAPDGAVQQYTCRVGFEDAYQDVARIYFHTGAPGPYRLELAVVKPSTVPVLVDRLQVRHALRGDDLFGDHRLQSAKQARTYYSEDDIARMRVGAAAPKPHRETPLAPAERDALDEVIWENCVPMNANYGGDQLYFSINSGNNAAPLEKESIGQFAEIGKRLAARDIGSWEPAGAIRYDQPFAYLNQALDLKYGMADYRANRRLPAPWPFPEDAGAMFFDQDEWGIPTSFNFGRVPAWMKQRYHACMTAIGDPDTIDARRGWRWGENLSARYLLFDDQAAAADGAFVLAAMAYRYPGHDFRAHCMVNVYRRSRRFTPTNWAGRGPAYMGWSTQRIVAMLRAYDAFFPYIAGNQELARRLGRFVPWVKTPDDVVRLVDTHLVQRAAIDVVRYRMYPPILPMAAVVLAGSPEGKAIAERYCRQILLRDNYSSFTDSMINGYSNDGLNYIGSTYYTHGESTDELLAPAALLSRYAELTGEARFDVSDPQRFPRLAALPDSLLGLYCAGGIAPAIGDVADIDRGPRWLVQPETLEETFTAAWQHTKAPRYAAFLRHYGLRSRLSEDAWQAVTAAAGENPADPRTSQVSRVLSGFGLVAMEEGQGSHLERAALTMRTGVASGHAQPDALNLELFAYGIRYLPDLGGRASRKYGHPSCMSSYTHNVVEVDERSMSGAAVNGSGTAWVKAFSAQPGRQFTVSSAHFESHPQVQLYQRSAAFISAGKDPLANCNAHYVFDVFRVVGGGVHTWCFHGVVPDDFSLNTPLATARSETALSYLHDHRPGSQLEGTAPASEPLAATWRLRREQTETTLSGKEVILANSEQQLLGDAYDEAAPRKFTRVWLFDHPGAEVLVGNWYCKGLSAKKAVTDRAYDWPFLYVREHQGASVWPAIIEPSNGDSLIRSRRRLEVAPRPGYAATPATAPIAVELVLHDGREDLLYSGYDAAPAVTRDGRQFSGQLLVVSRYKQVVDGFHLLGGATLQTPQLQVQLDQAAVRLRITQIRPEQLEVTVTGKVAVAALVGAVLSGGNGEHQTSTQVAAAEASDDGVRLRLQRSIVIFQGGVTAVSADGTLATLDVVPPLHDYHPDYYSGMTLINEAGTALGRLRLRKGDRYMYFGYPEWQQHHRRLDPEAITDADGDGRTELLLISRAEVKKRERDGSIQTYPAGHEMLRLEVTSVTDNGLRLNYRQHPLQYLDALDFPHPSWPYVDQLLRNETGDREWISDFPGDSYELSVPGRQLQLDDFPDVDGDGRRLVRFCDLGPGDELTWPSFVAGQRLADGGYALRTNAHGAVTINGVTEELQPGAAAVGVAF